MRAASMLALGWLALAGCQRAAPAPVSDAGAVTVTVTVDAGPAQAAADDDSDLPPRLAYAGSESCRDCHVSQFDGWSHDWHRRALTVATPANAVGPFTGVRYRGQSTEATMLTRDGGFAMKTADREGVVHDYPVAWFVGGKRMQDALTEFDDGRWQVLPVYFHVTGQGAWVDYNEAKQGVVGPQHPFFWQNFRRTANRECLPCHATGVTVRYAREEHRWQTSLVEPGVGCEACHGPGARHAETKALGDIVSFSKLSPALTNSVCASCHGPREPNHPLLDASHRFVPGQPYEASFQPSGLVDGDQRSGEFFVDGRPSSSSFEWQALQQSKCFREGGVTCLTCHVAPHAAGAANELKKGASLDAPCRSCHQAEANDARGHSHHATAKGQSCVGCHMPKVLSGVLDHFADHALDVPVPENTVKHSVPNACGVCHPTFTAAALAERTEAWWPQSSRRARRVRLADAFDEKTKAQSADALVKVVGDEAEAPLLRGFAAELLGQRFADRAATTLPAVLGANDAYLRSRALSGLSSAKAKTAADAVAARLGDESVVVREFAAMLLTSWGDARGPLALVKLANAPETKTLVRPHLALAQRAAAAKRFDEARREVEAVLALMPYSPSALLLEADLAMQRKDVAAAKAAVEECLRFDPGNVGAARRREALEQAP